MSRRLASSLLIWSGCAGLCIGGALADPPSSPSETLAQEVRAVFEQCRQAITKIEAVDIHGELSGTGFFIDPNGTLYTSYTVGGESRDIVVRIGNQKHPARRLMADPRSGIALLKVDAATPFLLPGRSRDLSIASPVVTIGYPMDLPLTPAFGIIGGFDLQFRGSHFFTTHIRANVPVQRGEGGAPMLNMRGEVIGILISSVDSGSASFALPIEAAEKVRRDFLRFGAIRPGWMGVHVALAPESVSGSYTQIKEVEPGGPADRAGLRKGDVIVQIGEKKITGIEDLRDASFFITAEETITLQVVRAGNPHQIQLTPSHAPTKTPSAGPAVGAFPGLGDADFTGGTRVKIDR
jgi:serine protease Do